MIDLQRARAHAAIDIVRFVSGQLDDELIVTARQWIGDGRVDDAVLSVAVAVLGSGALLHDGLVGSVADLLKSDDLAVALAAGSATSEALIQLRHVIEPTPRDDAHAHVVAGVAARSRDVITVWCGSRRPPLEAPWPPARSVWVVEARPQADVASLTLELQNALAGNGVDLPIVEVRHVGAEPTSTELAITEIGNIAWTRLEDGEIHIASVFDFGVDGDGGFDADHLRIAPAERERLLAYLRAGTVLVSMYSDLIDVVDSRAHDQVPVDLKTDGHWIWSDATRYYLERHGLAPVEPFLSYLRAVEGVPPAIDTRTLRRAFAVAAAEIAEPRIANSAL